MILILGSRYVWYESEPNVDFSGPISIKYGKTRGSNGILEATDVY